MLDLKQNYFDLFSLPVSFAVEAAVLTNNYRALQQVVHPDKFANGTAQQKRFSIQAAAYINEAYQVLGDGLKRAAYLLSLQGIDLNAETDTQVDPAFLMAQIEYREQLEAVSTSEDPFSAADSLRRAITADVAALQRDVSQQLFEQAFDAARDTVRKWQFLAKLTHELSETEYQLEESGG